MNIKYGAKSLYTPVGKIYTIGDVHNEADKLQDVLTQLEPLLTKDDHVVFCGDLVNRGKQAARTIEILVEFIRRYPDQVFFVRGNHDFMLQNYLINSSIDWISYLGITLNDLKDKWNLPDVAPSTITQALLDKGFKEITSRMIPYYETEKILVTHAPLDLSIVMMYGGDRYEADYVTNHADPKFKHLLERMSHEIMWEFTAEQIEIPCIKKFRVCGHQPGSFKHPRIFRDRAFIDSGCGKGNRPLTCMVYPGKTYFKSRVS